MVTDWETTQVYRDLPPAVWQFIKDRGFLGMSIAKAYGGLGFSAQALMGYVLLVAAQATFIHANVRWEFPGIRRFVATPCFHHSSTNFSCSPCRGSLSARM